MKSLGQRNLRVGVVGLGKMGLLHASILSTLPEVELAAVCEKSSLIRSFFKRMFKSRALSLVDDVEKLSHLGLDAIYVTTPIPSHAPIVKAISKERLARGIFVEKTLASNPAEANELCQSVLSLESTNMVGYMKRFAVTFKKAKEILAGESLGKIVSFKAYAYSSDFLGLGKGKSSTTSLSRGGVLRDLGAHIIDIALWFFGDLDVDMAKLESLGGNSSEDSASFKVRNSVGIEGSFDMSWCKENYRMPEFGVVISGQDGMMHVDDYKVDLELSAGHSSRWYRQDLNDNVDFLLGEPEYFREDEYFMRSLREGSTAEPSFLTASKVDYTIDKVRNRAEKYEVT